MRAVQPGGVACPTVLVAAKLSRDTSYFVHCADVMLVEFVYVYQMCPQYRMFADVSVTCYVLHMFCISTFNEKDHTKLYKPLMCRKIGRLVHVDREKLQQSTKKSKVVRMENTQICIGTSHWM